MSNITWHHHKIEKKDRAALKTQRAVAIWFTGLSGSGKSTIANALEEALFARKHHTYLLDGDNIRFGLNKDLGFSDSDREENIRRIGEVTKLFVDSGLIVLSAFVSPFAKDRDFVRTLLLCEEFIEVFIDTPLQTCEARDVKGLYQKARTGEIKEFTGISSPYEAPLNPEITIKDMRVDEAVEKIVDYLEQKGYLFG